MAITFDKALGSSNNSGSAVAITTGAIAAAASRIVVCTSLFATGFTSLTYADSGGSYTQDLHVANGSDHFFVHSRVLVGSLASGQAITPTLTASGLGGYLNAACSYLGTTGVDTTSQNTTTGTSFSSGAASNSVADALFVGGAGNETASTSVGGTNTNGASRFDIWNATAGQGMRMLDLIASSIGSQALTGTWANTSTATTGGLLIYKGTASAIVLPPPPQYLPRRMGPKAVGPTFFSPPNPPIIYGISPPAAGILGVPAYLPRLLGPPAGPAFFAGIPPLIYGIPVQRGLPIPAAYLPRSLGPRAVGPTFFAALQPAPTVVTSLFTDSATGALIFTGSSVEGNSILILGQPAYLPRSLGPLAGPQFFAGIPPLTYGQPGFGFADSATGALIFGGSALEANSILILGRPAYLPRSLGPSAGPAFFAGIPPLVYGQPPILFADSSTGNLIFAGSSVDANTILILGRPAYLPRRLGPAAGPSFFAGVPPLVYGTPAQRGIIIPGAYLPRSLGPAAVGPTFFAGIPALRYGQFGILYVDAATGLLVFAGSDVEAASFSQTASGTLIFAGSDIEAWTGPVSPLPPPSPARSNQLFHAMPPHSA